MATYKTVTYSCGHEGLLYVGGLKSANKSLKIEWAKKEGLCPECYKKMMKEARNQINQEKARENAFPDLTGSEKQISWANDIRHQFYEYFMEAVKHVEKTPDIERMIDNTIKMLKEADSARFWIDARAYTRKLPLLLAEYDKWSVRKSRKAESESGENTEQSQVEKDAKEESTLVPESLKFEGTVEVQIVGDTINVLYPIKDSTFSNLLRSLSFKWDRSAGAYVREITEWKNGTVKDRASEVVNNLLLKGFRVMCLDEDIREKAIRAKFSRECTRWIVRFEGTNKLGVRWDRNKGDDLYNEAKSLPGAKWDRDRGAMMIDTKDWREIRDFADIYEFGISPGAEKALKTAEESELPVKPEKVQVEEKADHLKEILKEEAEIPNDLKDED